MGCKIKSAAMRVVKVGAKGGPHDDIFRYRGIGDFGVSVFYGPGRFHRPKASSLNRVRAGKYSGFMYERPDFGLATLHSGATAHAAQPSAGIVFRF